MLIKKIISILKGEPNFDVTKPIIFNDFVINIKDNKNISIFYKEKKIIENLWFKGKYYETDFKTFKIKKTSSFDLNFKIQKNKKSLFMMFENINPLFVFQGSVTLTFKKNEIICEHRYFADRKTKLRITNFLEFDQSFESSQNFQTLKSDLYSMKINLESTQNYWEKEEKIIINSHFPIESPKGNKELIVKYNNKNYQTLKISIGEINEKV